jgi:hypothetical protein
LHKSASHFDIPQENNFDASDTHSKNVSPYQNV